MRADRGAILIHVALAIAMLFALSAFVIDRGVFWVARGEAQTAADAGALAGALSRALDEASATPAANGPAQQAATATAVGNLVSHVAPGVAVAWDCPPFVAHPDARCAQVEVYRDGTHGSTAMPTVFGRLLNLQTQGVRASATAAATPVYGSDCLRPWAVSDRWLEQNAPATPASFNRYASYDKKTGTFTLFSPPDVYAAPTADDAGTGYRVPTDAGTRVTLKLGQAKDEAQIDNGWYLAVDLPGADGGFESGANAYREHIGSACGSMATVVIGDYLPAESGNMVGPTRQGVAALVAQDPGAYWDASARVVRGSCAETDTCPDGQHSSPRVAAIAVFDPDQFQSAQVRHDWSACPGGGPCVRLVNILGFFVEGVTGGGDVTGILLKMAGTRTTAGWQVGDPSAFLWTVNLVR